MRVRRILTASRLYPSDTLRQRQIPAGIEGLRHKSRHTIPHKATRKLSTLATGCTIASLAPMVRPVIDPALYNLRT